MGVVPEIEAREAAVFSGYTWPSWNDLEPDQRASSVAHYRLHLLIDSHINDAVERSRK